jgi:uroporphyrinogen-III decarboxylase
LLQGKVFIKGNIDPVHTLLNGDLETVQKDVRWRLEVGKPGGGYILSSACSIAPHTPPRHIEQLALLSEQEGIYAR